MAKNDRTLVYVAFALRLFALTDLHNIHHFLIYALVIFGLTSSGFPRSITLTPTYSIMACG